jgi:hypothetical protein
MPLRPVIPDGDMTGAAYETGKDPAFQFVGEVMGGTSIPIRCAIG